MSNKNTFGIEYIFFIIIAGLFLISVKYAIIIGTIVLIILFLSGKLKE